MINQHSSEASVTPITNCLNANYKAKLVEKKAAKHYHANTVT